MFRKSEYWRMFLLLTSFYQMSAQINHSSSVWMKPPWACPEATCTMPFLLVGMRSFIFSYGALNVDSEAFSHLKILGKRQNSKRDYATFAEQCPLCFDLSQFALKQHHLHLASWGQQDKKPANTTNDILLHHQMVIANMLANCSLLASDRVPLAR